MFLIVLQLMEVLGVEENGIVVIRSRQLPKASFVQFRPMSKVFYDFADPKALYVPSATPVPVEATAAVAACHYLLRRLYFF